MTLDLRDVLEHYGVRVTKSTGEFKFRCIVHPDRVASASANLDEGVWRCHACGAQGNTLGLIMMKEGIDRDEAWRFAADTFGAEGGTGAGDGDVRTVSLPFRDDVLRVKGHRAGRRNWVPPWRR